MIPDVSDFFSCLFEVIMIIGADWIVIISAVLFMII